MKNKSLQIHNNSRQHKRNDKNKNDVDFDQKTILQDKNTNVDMCASSFGCLYLVNICICVFANLIEV